MSTYLGMATTSNADQTFKTLEIERDIAMIQADEAPFMSLSMALGSQPSKQMKVQWTEDDYPEQTITVNGAVTVTTDTLATIVVTSGHAMRVKPGAMLWDSTANSYAGHYLRVTAVDLNLNTIYAMPNQAGSTAANIANSEVLIIAQESEQEGVEFTDAIQSDPTPYYNWMGEIETPVNMSWIQMATDDYITPPWDHNVTKAAVHHKRKYEAGCFFAGRTTDPVLGSQNRRMWYYGGLRWWIDTYGLPAHSVKTTGTLTKKTIDEWLASILTYGSPKRKMIFGNPGAWLILSRLADAQVTLQRSENTLGMTIQKVLVNGHTIAFVESQILSRLSPTRNWMFCADMSNIRMRYLNYRGFNFNTKWYRNLQTNATKGRKDSIHSIMGPQIKVGKSHGYITNFTG